MIKVTPLNDALTSAFTELFKNYYHELDCDDVAEHLIEEYILPDLLSGLINIEILEDGGKQAGFIIYQTDRKGNDWNFKEGWGDIREIYVAPSSRGMGFGRFLLYTAEMKLRESGTQKAYCLPYETAVPFFTACGYKKTDEYNEDLDSLVYEKTNLNNCCKK